jgi:hypothetical protein
MSAGKIAQEQRRGSTVPAQPVKGDDGVDVESLDPAIRADEAKTIDGQAELPGLTLVIVQQQGHKLSISSGRVHESDHN